MKEYDMRWGARWRQRGEFASEHLIFEDLMPMLFLTRAEARAWINKKYGYIRDRTDLRSEPHCWRLPIAVKVRIIEVTE